MHSPDKPHAKIRSLAPVSIRIKTYPSQLAISMQKKVRFISVSEILFLNAQANYTAIYMKDQTKLLASITLKRFEQRLNPEQFLRIHQGYIINANGIKAYYINDSCIELNNNKLIPVSRSKKSLINQFIKKITP